jgi:hypothetical protein
MSPRRYSSVKFLSPRMIGGLPWPGFALEPDEPEPELELELDVALDDDEPELPQAATKATKTRVPAIQSPRLSKSRIT